jgi:hypothetical protein
MEEPQPKPLIQMTDDEFHEFARAALLRELGTDGFLRLMALGGIGWDYTRDRHLWQDGTTVQDILERLHKKAS